MSQRFGVSRRLLAACTLILTSQALFVSTPTSAVSDDRAASCAELARWAEAYEGTSITLDEFARFDRAHRIAIFNAVSPDVRAALVQDQLRRFRERPDLSDTQRSLIGEALTVTTPALYGGDVAAKKAATELWTQADRTFTSIEHRRGLSDLGSVVVVAERSAAGVMSGALPSSLALGLTCNCHFGTQEECPGACSWGGCGTTPNGCGPGWGFPCDGRCQ